MGLKKGVYDGETGDYINDEQCKRRNTQRIVQSMPKAIDEIIRELSKIHHEIFDIDRHVAGIRSKRR